MNRCAGHGVALALAFLTAVSAAAAAARDAVFAPPAAGQTRWKETLLHRFRGGRDGREPNAGVIADAKGVLYGTTSRGGDNQNGTVFALLPPAASEIRWTHTVLYRFRGSRDGSFPGAGLIADAKASPEAVAPST